MKNLAKSVVRRMGYDIRRYHDPHADDRLAVERVSDSELYQNWSPPYPLFAPWQGHPPFERLYAGIAEHTIVPRERCYYVAGLTAHAACLPGNLAECGVFTGGTALLMCRASAASGKRIYLFDSFEGLPANDPNEDVYFEDGQFAIDDVDSVRRLLKDFEDVAEIRKGWIPDTFAGLEDQTFSFVHLDVDLYRSTLDCCEYFYPRLVSGGALLFDEYGFAASRGERDAVDEFFADKPESPIVLPTGQAFVLKLLEAAP